MDNSIKKNIEEKTARFQELERMMMDPAIQADSGRMAQTAREHGALAKIAHRFLRFKTVLSEIEQVRALADSDDPDECELAEAELTSLSAERERLWDELLEMTIGGEDAQRTRCVMEIRAGTGGEEAALFAGDLMRMYRKFAEDMGWKVEILDAQSTELGGFKEITLAFEGEDVYRKLQYESGGHRVQRVPETETKGRIHTSAATVAVLPEPEDIEVQLKPEDYRKDIFSASGPGGQHVNKTASAVRLTHLETGIVVSIQDEKSQHKNLAKALRVLKTRLFEQKQRQEHERRASERKTLVGSGDRSQRIRTYNFPDNRVTDHRIGFRANLDQVLAGDVGQVTQALLEYDRQQLRGEMVAS